MNSAKMYELSRCTTCYKKVQNNNAKRITCSICKSLRHLKCTPFLAIDVDVICPPRTNELFPFCNVESDIDFFEVITARVNFRFTDHHLLHELEFKIKCDFTSCALTLDDDIDVDANYYIMLFIKPVDYYETGKLNTTISDLASNATQMFMHINARSLSTNIDSIITELSLLVDKPAIIAITET